MEIVSSIVKDQLNRFIIEMGDFAMKKKTIIISGIAAVLVIGSVVFCFAVKGDSTQPAEVAQTVTEAVATPSIEVTQETPEEVSPEVVEEVPEVTEEPEVVEEVPEVQETSEEVSSIVDVAETSEEVSKDAGVSTQTEEVKPVEPKQEEVKPTETKPVETQPSQQAKTEPNVNQISTDEVSQALIAQLKADGAIWGDTPSTSTAHGFESSGGASLNIIVE